MPITILLLAFIHWFDIPDFDNIVGMSNDIRSSTDQVTVPPDTFSTRMTSEKPAPFDIVINEIMASPFPAVGLPEVQYIELLNCSDHNMNLNNWTITVGTNSRIITTEIILKPGDFLILTHEKQADRLKEFGNTAAVAAFPTIPSEGQDIVLRDENTVVISAVQYSDKWYGNKLKAEGGWSLEQIDPFNPCGKSDNWQASSGETGGTPGKINSVRKDNPDNLAPAPIRVTFLTRSSIRLHLSEFLHPESDWSPMQFHVEKMGNPLYAMPLRPFYNAVDLYFASNFEENISYTLTVEGNMHDCAGNKIMTGNGSISFALPVLPLKNEIIINEILFDPFPGGVNFIELVNISEKTFDLGKLMLAGAKQGLTGPPYNITQYGYLLLPGKFAVLTTDPEILLSHYYSPDPYSLIAMDQMPPLGNIAGRISLTDEDMNIIEELSYTSDMHTPLLTNTKGVSLERIDCKRPATDPSNWLSASESSGFATPGYKNSQSSPTGKKKQNILSVDPKIFSPGNNTDGDMVNIHLSLSKPGYIASINIFNSKGRLVRRLMRNELQGTGVVCSWNGNDEANRRLSDGIYIIMLELFHPGGDVGKYKETVVLTNRSVK